MANDHRDYKHGVPLGCERIPGAMADLGRFYKHGAPLGCGKFRGRWLTYAVSINMAPLWGGGKLPDAMTNVCRFYKHGAPLGCGKSPACDDKRAPVLQILHAVGMRPTRLTPDYTAGY